MSKNFFENFYNLVSLKSYNQKLEDKTASQITFVLSTKEEFNFEFTLDQLFNDTTHISLR